MKTVLITGGSSGLGFEISKYFAKQGYHLLWVSKPEDELIKAKTAMLAIHDQLNIQYLAIDLTKEGAVDLVYEWAASLDVTIDVLINNAGFGTHGFINEIAIEKELNMIELNVITMYKMTRKFLDDMIASNQGSIINISSISAFNPIPRMATYASTKAFVRHFTLGLIEELKLQKSNVHVMAVYPAAVKNTSFRKTMNTVRTFDGMFSTTAEEVAKDVWTGFTKRKNNVITGSRYRMAHVLNKIMPSGLVKILASRETETINS